MVGPAGRARGATGTDGAQEALVAGHTLLPASCGSFWTEHSERNGLPTAAAALGCSDDVVRRLGRWQVGAVAEAYVRTTINIVARAQRKLAARVRNRGPDFLDERTTLERLGAHLRKRGLGEGDVRSALNRVTYFDQSDRRSGAPEGTTEAGKEEDICTPTESVDGSDSEATPEKGEEEPGQVQEADGAHEEVALRRFVVSIVGRKRFRRLHHISRCGMLPGTDYKDFEWFGDVLPAPAQYDQSLRPRGAPSPRRGGVGPVTEPRDSRKKKRGGERVGLPHVPIGTRNRRGMVHEGTAPDELRAGMPE